MSKQTLDAWLDSLNQDKIDLGLARVQQVHQNLRLKNTTTITVAGTNGKGSTVAILTALLKSMDKKVGAFTSPHIFTFNERVAIDGEPVSDEVLIVAFERIETARGEINLSYFEWAFLVACCVFDAHNVDVQVMEVGLGGRLDAVNVLDADAAIITGIDIDHVEWLGDDIEVIGKEKAGVLRANQVAAFGANDCPESIKKQAQDINCDLKRLNQDYEFQIHDTGFDYVSESMCFEGLNRPNLQGNWQIQNAAAAINVLLCMGYGLNKNHINHALQNIQLSGRLQTISEQPKIIADVAHNAQSAEALADWLRQNPIQGQTRAVFSVLKDKQVETWLSYFEDLIDHWFVFELEGARAMPLNALKITMPDHANLLSFFDSAEQAHQMGLKMTQNDDRLLVFGSFHVLDEVLQNHR